MRQPDQLVFLDRLLTMVRSNTRDDAPGVSHAPVEEYLDPLRYRQEVELFFRRSPVVVAFSDQVRQPGDFVTHDATGQPILVVRGTDGVLRAFLNVCRHRSATVEAKPCGSGKRAFVCPYHGWSYDLTGRLLGITDGHAFGEVDRPSQGLRPLAVAEKYGLVWVVPSPLASGETAGIDIDRFLGTLQPDLAEWDMANWSLHTSVAIRPRMNWKLVIDTFLEQYHFRFAHSGSVARLFLDNIAAFERMGPHMRVAAAKRSLSELEARPREDWRIREHAVVLYQLFPSTVLIYGQDHCSVFTTFPVSVEESILHLALLVDPQERLRKPESYWKATGDLLQTALAEDFAIGENIQRNFHSGANRQQTFGKFEKALGWYHHEVDRALVAKG
jgi:phenylpropionate dioxygenase-like ring-hydroxylating dioxygenase large terminal subunit